ncbi:MAG: secretin N-terminal domain-containing protein [Thauera sp.]|jgi:general secretion pathway protein D|nr:secretin N-terminal domain-containing protein [Thauera sp.]
MPTLTSLTLLLLATLLTLISGCAPLPPAEALRGHLDADAALNGSDRAADAQTRDLQATATVPPEQLPAALPPPALPRSPTPPTPPAPPLTPPPGPPEPTYSISVESLPLRQLLLAIGRDAGLNLDLHPGLEGEVSLHAIDQTLEQLLQRIARQAPIRYQLSDKHLSIEPDLPFLRSYAVDYVNLSRSMEAQVATSTQIATGQTSGNDGANSSLTRIETRSRNDFWDALLANVDTIVNEQASQCSNAPCQPPNILLNRESGVLMVRASARQHTELAHFLQQVQQAARRQVMIEATIVEVSLADGWRQGVDWSRLKLPGWNIRTVDSNGGGLTTVNLSFSSASSELQLELLETFGTVKVLSSPRLSVLNNQTAMLKVVEEYVYFLVDATTTEYDDSRREKITATTTPQSVSVGMVMAVTPQISASGEITLNVRPTISAIAGFRDDPNPSLRNIPNRVPQIRTREIESMLRLRSGEIAVLGGLMEDRIDHDTARLPLLGELPVLGELFTRRDNKVARTELLIFLRPLLIDDASVHGDYRSYAGHLPDDRFLAQPAAADTRSLPARPLRPLSGWLDHGTPAPTLDGAR